MLAGLVLFNYFQSLSLGRVGLPTTNKSPSVLSIRLLREKEDNMQGHQRTQLFFRTGWNESAPNWQRRQGPGEGGFS